jgi:multisubunit Na+/H+ antiporter MnhG subunit
MRYFISAILIVSGAIGIALYFQRVEANQSYLVILIPIFCIGLILYGIALLTKARNRIISAIATIFLISILSANLVLHCTRGEIPFCPKPNAAHQ